MFFTPFLKKKNFYASVINVSKASGPDLIKCNRLNLELVCAKNCFNKNNFNYFNL